MKLLLALAMLVGACDAVPERTEARSWQVGDQWCTEQLDGRVVCEPLDGEIEVR